MGTIFVLGKRAVAGEPLNTKNAQHVARFWYSAGGGAVAGSQLVSK